MWTAKIRLKHDCIIGNRCKKFKIILQSYDLTEEKKGKRVLTSSLHQMVGERNDIEIFIADLKKDKRTEYSEVNGNTLFLVESAAKKPVSQFKRKMFFVKPVIIDTKGIEHWEIASYKKEGLIEFIKKVKPICENFNLEYIKNTKLSNLYFPKVLPMLTEKQKRALELAVQNKYYESPKKIGLRELAKLMKISLATYQKHLQRAESKVMPDILAYLK